MADQTGCAALDAAGQEAPGEVAPGEGAVPAAGESTATTDGSDADEMDGWVEQEPGVWVEAGNAVWSERDWSNVPVAPRPADPGEPPEEWDEGCRSWIDDVPAPELGPVSWLDELAPSARLMGELEGLPAEVVDSDYDSVEMVAHWARLAAYCAAKQREAAAALARRELMAGGLANLDHLDITVSQPNIAGDELALRLGIGKQTAVRMMNAGRAMNGVAIPTAEALEAGEIDAAKADIIALGVEDLAPDAALEVQELVLAKASYLPAGSVRRELAIARAKVEPQAFEERCADAARARRVDRPKVLPDGMASIFAVLPAAGANQVYRAVDAAARSSKAAGDARTLDQLRADALALMGAGAIDTGWIGPCPHSHPATGEHRNASGTSGTSGSRARARNDQTHPPGQETSPTPRPRCDTPRDVVRATGGAATLPDQCEAVPQQRTGAPARPPATLAEPPPPEERGAGSDAPPLPTPPGHTRHGPSHPPGDPPEVQRDGEPCPISAGETSPDGMDPGDAAAWSAAGAGVCPPPDVRMRVGQIGGKSAHIRVVVPLTALMGGDGGPGADLEGADMPATLEGYGPIPASVARALAAGGNWARMVTDPVDRSVLELTTDKYEPPAAVAALVRAKQPECVHPSCSVPSDSCDLNHRLPWPAGVTSVRELDPECRRDHLLVTHAGWSYTLHPDGGRTWTTPTGHVYTEHADGTLAMRRQRPPAQSPLADRHPDHDPPPPF